MRGAVALSPRRLLAIGSCAMAFCTMQGALSPALAQAAGGNPICEVGGAVPVIGGALEPACEAVLNPLKLGEWLAGSGWGALKAILGTITGAASKAVGAVLHAVVNPALDAISKWIAGGAVWVMSRVAKLIQATTTPNVTGSWYTSTYSLMGQIAVLFALPLLLLAVLRGVLHHSVSEIARAALVQLPLAIALTAAAVALTQMALVITDQLSADLARSVGHHAEGFLAGATKAMIALTAGTSGGALPGFFLGILGVLGAITAFVLWLELLLRSASIYVVLLFMPLAFVSMIWQRAGKVARRMAEILFAIIVSKLLIIAIIALAVSALAHIGGSSSIDAVMSAIVLMGLAIFAPLTILRLVPLAEAAVAHHGAAAGQVHDWRGNASRKASDHVRRAFDERTAMDVGGGGLGGQLGSAGVVPAAPGMGAAGRGGAASSAGATGAGGGGGAAATAGVAGVATAGVAIAATAAANAVTSRTKTGGGAASAALGAEGSGSASQASQAQPALSGGAGGNVESGRGGLAVEPESAAPVSRGGANTVSAGSKTAAPDDSPAAGQPPQDGATTPPADNGGLGPTPLSTPLQATDVPPAPPTPPTASAGDVPVSMAVSAPTNGAQTSPGAAVPAQPSPALPSAPVSMPPQRPAGAAFDAEALIPTERQDG